MFKPTDEMNELVAVVTGVGGQDGFWLSKLLLDKGYEVIGVVRRRSGNQEYKNVKELEEDCCFHKVFGDITDAAFINDLVSKYRPEKYFNIAAMSHVGQSFKEPLATFDADARAVLIALEAIRLYSPKTKFYQASTSEMMGGLDCPSEGYDETCRLNPRSPYAVAKVAAHNAVRLYRGAYDIFACSGILFNHSSIIRGEDFATRKITLGVANILAGNQEHLFMGNMEAIRDEGSADEYVAAMNMMLDHDVPGDYVVATGETASIKEMLEYVCELAGLRYEDVYRPDERFMRPSDVPYLKGNAYKAQTILGWQPKKKWKELLKEMFENDCKLVGVER